MRPSFNAALAEVRDFIPGLAPLEFQTGDVGTSPDQPAPIHFNVLTEKIRFHLPWAVILDDGIKSGQHTAKVRLADGHDPKANGTALRVFHLLLN